MDPIGPIPFPGATLSRPALPTQGGSKLLVTAIGARNSEALGKVVDASLNGAAEARRQRALQDAERSSREERRDRADRIAREEQQTAEAVSRRFRAERQQQDAESEARRQTEAALDARAARRSEQTGAKGRFVDLYA